MVTPELFDGRQGDLETVERVWRMASDSGFTRSRGWIAAALGCAVPWSATQFTGGEYRCTDDTDERLALLGLRFSQRSRAAKLVRCALPYGMRPRAAAAMAVWCDTVGPTLPDNRQFGVHADASRVDAELLKIQAGWLLEWLHEAAGSGKSFCGRRLLWCAEAVSELTSAPPYRFQPLVQRISDILGEIVCRTLHLPKGVTAALERVYEPPNAMAEQELIYLVRAGLPHMQTVAAAKLMHARSIPARDCLWQLTYSPHTRAAEAGFAALLQVSPDWLEARVRSAIEDPHPDETAMRAALLQRAAAVLTALQKMP